MNKITELIKKYKIALIGMLLGFVAGYAYYHFVGCASGTCAITSKPLNSTLYGGLMGFLLFDLFPKKKKSHEHKES
jgi:hypothetical protein